jgi:hypothetical protein
MVQLQFIGELLFFLSFVFLFDKNTYKGRREEDLNKIMPVTAETQQINIFRWVSTTVKLKERIVAFR